MADKAISDLTQATTIYDTDMFLLEQGSKAKYLLGSTLKTYAEDAGEAAAGNLQKGDKGDTGTGITSIALTSGTHAAGTTDTYTITFDDGTTTTFQVYNGADGSGAVDSVNGYTGSVTLALADVMTSEVIPIENGGTGAATADEALTSLGATKMIPLWTNSSPDSTFAAQSLNIDCTDYGMAVVLVRARKDYDNYTTAILVKNYNMSMTGQIATNNYIYYYMRDAELADDSITFGAGLYIRSGSTNTTSTNEAMVPIKIWGVRV